MGVLNPRLVVQASRSDTGADMIRLTAKSATTNETKDVGRAYLSHFPGCCGIAILHDAWADSPEIESLLFEIREEMAVNADKGLLVYTDVHGDEPPFLRKLGYRTSTRGFYNPNSGNTVTVWTKRISQGDF